MPGTLFSMWEHDREQLITRHNFYIDQVEKQLLSQFSNLGEKADKYEKEWRDKAGQNFDPDRHDPAYLYDRAYDEGINFYIMLEEMRNRMRMSVIAGMFHEWDKQLRSWLADEIHHWKHGDRAKEAVWKANFSDIIDLLEGVGCAIKSKEYYLPLDRCRLVVNAYKHGNGGSFDTLKQKHPDFIDNLEDSDNRHIEYADYTYLRVEAAHITEFSTAIIAFWRDIPEDIFDDQPLNFPVWFKNAFQNEPKEKSKRKSNDWF